jgi:AraC family transcriptional activator of pobA
MSRHPRTSLRNAIPDFGLYGEPPLPQWYDPFYLERISERSRLHNWEIHAHRHNALIQILYIETGSAESIVEGAKFKLVPGCVLLIPAHAVHSHRFEPDIEGPVVTAAQRPLESLASVSSPELVQWIREPRMVQASVGTGERNAVELLLDLLELESHNSAPDHVTASLSLLFSLLVQIARLGHAASLCTSSARDGKAARMEKFRQLVDQHVRTSHSVESYAKSLGVTASQLGRLSNELIGMSPLDFIHSRILKEAQRDLVYTSLSVKQVALGLGFDDPAYFSRFFLKQTGLNPTQFREAAHRELLPQR